MKSNSELTPTSELSDRLQLQEKIQHVLELVNQSEKWKQMWQLELQKLQKKLTEQVGIPNSILHQSQTWEKLIGGSGLPPVEITKQQIKTIEDEINLFLQRASSAFETNKERSIHRDEVVAILNLSFTVVDDALYLAADQMRNMLLAELTKKYSRRDLELSSLFHVLGGSSPKTDLDSTQNETTQKINNEISVFVLDTLQPVLRVTKL